jgi:hypothetical protein
MRFDGADYQAPRDHDRLVRQYDKVFDLMSDRLWRSLKDISDAAILLTENMLTMVYISTS